MVDIVLPVQALSSLTDLELCKVDEYLFHRSSRESEVRHSLRSEELGEGVKGLRQSNACAFLMDAFYSVAELNQALIIDRDLLAR